MKKTLSFLTFILILASALIFIVGAVQILDSTQANFNNGTYSNNTVFNSSLGVVAFKYYNDTQRELPDRNASDNLGLGLNMSRNILLMHMNERGGTINDSSGKGKNASVTGGVSYGLGGKLNSSLSFDGSGYLETASNIGIGSAQARSIMGWVKTSNVDRQAIFGWGDASETLAFVLESGVNGDGTLYFVGYGADISSSASIADNLWHFVAVNYDGTTVKMYKDGFLVGTSDYGLATVDSHLVIGRQAYGDGDEYWHFNGNIDEVAVFNRSLSNAEINQIYLRQKGNYGGGVNGNFTSRIFNASSAVNWSNISWISNNGELPNNNQKNVKINMSGNRLLMHLNELGGDINDSSGKGTNGTINGGVYYGDVGKLNNSLGFDGSGYVSFSDVNLPAVYNPGTYSAWVKSNADCTGNQYSIIFQYGADTFGQYFFMGAQAFSNEIIITQSGQGVLTSGVNICDGNWHLLTVTKGGDGSPAVTPWVIYVDGVDRGSGDMDSYTTLTGQANLGGEPNHGDYGWWNGNIDEFAIWNRTLSSQEVANMYARGAARLNLSVRTCDDGACSGESFTNLALADTPVNLVLPNNPYFQYKYDFSTEDSNYTPELYNITINYLKGVSFANPTLESYSNSSRNWTFANISVAGIVSNDFNSTFEIYNSSGLFNRSAFNSQIYVINWTELRDGVYTYNASVTELSTNLKFNTETRVVTIDITKPLISFGSGTGVDYANVSRANIFVNVSASDTNEKNITFALYNATGSVNITMFTSAQRTINWTNLPNGRYTYNVTIYDYAGNTNNTGTRTITLDTVNPSITNVSFFPNETDDVDPTVNMTFNASVTDSLSGVQQVILQYHNGTNWNNATMSLISGNTYQANITTSGSQKNYTFNVYTSDYSSNLNQTVNRTFASFWDCTWSFSPFMFSSTTGFDEIKTIGNLTINNTGDPQFTDNACTLSFRLTHNLPSSPARVYFDGSSSKPSATYVLAAKTNRTIELNVSFLDEILEELLYVSALEKLEISTVLNRTSNVTLISSAGAYLADGFESLPQDNAVSITPGNVTLSASVRNVADASTNTINRTAHNVSFNWTLPAILGDRLIDGNISNFYSVLNTTDKQYSNLTIAFTAENIAALSQTNLTIGINAFGYENSSGNLSIIIHAGNRTVLTESTTINLLCYLPSDGVTVSGCGELDGDFVPSVDSGGGGGGSSGGGGGSGGGAVQSRADYTIIRGKESQISVPFRNKNLNVSMTDLKFSVTGNISKYIAVVPSSLSVLGAGKETNLTIKITSPTYIPLGKQEITLHVNGQLGTQGYNEDRRIILQINSLPKGEVETLLNEAGALINDLRALNLSSEKLSKLLNESYLALNNLEYEKIQENYDIIKAEAGAAIEAKTTISELTQLIKDANEKGISTKSSERLLKLAQLSLERSDFIEAAQRAKEARNAFAIETKGEFGSLSYYLKNNTKNIALSVFVLAIITFTTYKLARLRMLKRKVRKLKEEEFILTQLIKLAQQQTFTQKKMEMEEYRETMVQYEKKMAQVIEDIIDAETEVAHVLKFTSVANKLKAEKERVISLIKEIQYAYLRKGTIEGRAYELKIESYNRRLGEIEEKLAELEAKQALKHIK